MTVRDLLYHLNGFRVYIHVGASGRLVMPRELKLYYNKRVEDWLVFAETNTVIIRCSPKDVYDEGDTRIEGLTMQGGEVNSKVKPLGIRQPKRPVPKPIKPKDVHQLIRMLYKKDKEVERLRSTLMEIATKFNVPVDDIDEL